MADATADQPTADAPAIELTEGMRTLRDHLLGTFPSAQASAFRGELTILVPPADLLAVLAFCKNDPAVACELLSDLAAVHWPAGVSENNDQETTGWPTFTEVNTDGRIELDYLLRSISRNHWLRVRVEVPDVDPAVQSATAQYASANFMEREVLDLMGVTFTDHPNPARIMMPEDWEGHPHRKDYPLGGVEVMYKGHTVAPPDERDY
ncbi:MAG TPA: NADH-quinone oxidoreductase subunit C [Euzebya sp.]|nr:NADH-quinone oxidoreductase subunit C [Euzebya sp.]